MSNAQITELSNVKKSIFYYPSQIIYIFKKVNQAYSFQL